jgi:hypothetical protein
MNDGVTETLSSRFSVSKCAKCHESALWDHTRLIHPEASPAPRGNTDMPLEVASDYEEAALVASRSPAAAAALLRRAVDKLCIFLGAEGRDLSARIGALVKAGMPQTIQQALDIVRVTGNEAVHPGTLDLNDNPEVAHRLFDLVNEIVENRMSLPKRMTALYAELPETARDGIVRRDGESDDADSAS